MIITGQSSIIDRRYGSYDELPSVNVQDFWFCVWCSQFARTIQLNVQWIHPSFVLWEIRSIPCHVRFIFFLRHCVLNVCSKVLFPSGNKRTIAIKIVCFKLQLERIKLDCNTKPHISIRPTCVGRQIIVHCCEASLLSSHSKAIIHVAPAFTGPFTIQINYFHRNENFCCKKFNVFVGTSTAANKGRDFSCSWQSLEKGALR